MESKEGREMKKKVIVGLLLMAVIGIGVWKFHKKSEREEKVYSIISVHKKQGNGYIEAKGRVEVNDTISVFVDKSLKVKEIFVKEGDYVEKGQILMTFDDLSKNKLLRAMERERLQLQKLKRNYEVERSLEKIGGASLNSLKDMQEEIRIHELNLEEYQEDFQKTASEIVSPANGTVSSLTAQENYLVNTDTPLLKIADLSNIKIVLEIPEYNVRYLKLGEKLSLQPEIFEEKESFSGEIVRIGKIAKVSPSTSENILEVEVKPLEEIPYIVPGFKVSAKIELQETKEEKRILIPKTALLEENGSFYVFSLAENQLAMKKGVEAEILSGQEAAILKGLQEGDKIIANPDVSLKEGDKILDSNQKSK
ncbi:efflux transporter, RND family, MFP subunit [Fusobacterium equinum]|uniref:Efflux transporter, RND family, MFP subunit n=3 Tax=Fusobacteriaceae TaxID=203492 RepID=A0A133NKF4_9FUSO|nr:efflux transporter, RND family, MFP subunit [Fusobacterium equinum]